MLITRHSSLLLWGGKRYWLVSRHLSLVTAFKILPSCVWIELIESLLRLGASQNCALRQPALARIMSGVQIPHSIGLDAALRI